MLVLGRNLNETIVIDGKIFIKIVRGKLGSNLKVAIEAPREVSIVRASGVVTGTVDAETRGQLLQRLRHGGVVHAQLTVSVQRHRVGSYGGELFPGIEKMEAKWAKALGPDRN